MELAKGYKQTELGIIPEDWQVKTMNETGENIIGLTYSPKDVKEFGHLVLRSSNIQNNKLAFDNNVFVEMELPKRVIVKENDILICVRNGSKQLIGKCALIDKATEGSAFGAFMSVYRTTFAKYIFHQFQSNVIQRQIDEVMGATINQLTNKNLASFKIPFPKEEVEQTAISNALSNIDELISQTEKLIDKKKAIKNGVMQELFKPKDGWNIKKLGEICEIIKGQLITDNTRINGDIPVIAGGKKPAYFNNIPNRLGKTITISGSGASAGYVSFHDYPIFASDCSTISESLNYNIEFLYYWLKVKQNNIYKMQTGGAQPHIHPSDLNPLEIWLPSINKQQEISEIITDLDSDIKVYLTKLQKLKLQRQGMMHALLTGKIRLL